MSSNAWYEVPAKTPTAQCRGCGAVIYWITTKNDRKMPVDCDVDEGHAPDGRIDGRGVSHFTTCTEANRFSGTSRRRS